MATTSAPMDYISLDEGGTARIAGTGIKVRILAEELRAGYRPEDIHAAHDGLSMAQVYAALAYYYANKAAFDESIDRGVHAATEDLAEADHVLSRETLVNRLQARSHGSDA